MEAGNPVKHSKNITNTVGRAKCVSDSLLVLVLILLSRKYDVLEPITTRINEKPKQT